MPHVEVDPQTFEVRADGKLSDVPTCNQGGAWRGGICCDEQAFAERHDGQVPGLQPRASGSADRSARARRRLVERLIPALLKRGVDIAVITNDLVTAEDAERIRRSGLIDPARVSAVEAGACPHTVIREDPTLNIEAADELGGVSRRRADPAGGGGDNLASTFSRDLTDFWMFVIDVAGGDDIPRKRGPGVIRADLFAQ